MASNPPSPSSPSRQAAPMPCQPPEDVVYRRTLPRPRETDNSQNHVLLSRNAAVQLSWDGATHPAQLELRHNRGLSHGFIRLRLLNILLHETKGAQAFYAYIPPESIQHMSLVSPAAEEGPGETASEASDTCVHRLCFELLRPPDVFGPNCTWTGRDLESVAMLESLAGLASATSLVVLVPTRVAKQTQWGAFSAIASKGSMRSIETLYYTKSLYGGNGARRHGSVAPDAGPLLPSYTEASVPSYAGPSNRAGPSTNAAFTGQRALKRPRRSSSLPAEAISSHPPKRVDTRPRETPGQPLVTHADLARLYGGNGGRLQTPDSFPLLRPPPYMPEDAADLTASDDASAPAYESKAPANHCQATMGESCTFPDTTRSLTVILNSLVLQPAVTTGGPAVVVVLQPAVSTGGPAVVLMLQPAVSTGGPAAVRARRLRQHRPAVASATSFSPS
jgi:hypothetical protein